MSTAGLDCTLDRPNSSHAVVRAAGELDIATAELLKTRLRDARWTDADRLTIDLRSVSFIETCGVHLLLDEAAEAGGRWVTLEVVASPRVDAVLRLACAPGLRRQLGSTAATWIPDRRSRRSERTAPPGSAA